MSRTCSPRFKCFRLYIKTGDSPHGRVSLSTESYAFYILYPCEWQIKTQQVYLTNASAFLTLYIFSHFFHFLVCFKNLWMCSDTHKIIFLKNRKHAHCFLPTVKQCNSCITLSLLANQLSWFHLAVFRTQKCRLRFT